MATLSGCGTTPAILVMNYVQPQSDYIDLVSSSSNLASTIASRNGKLSTFTRGEIYSSSNYLKIKRIALSGDIVTPNGTCGTNVRSLLAAQLPASANFNNQLILEINNILARG
jgi:hypothetical protein